MTALRTWSLLVSSSANRRTFIYPAVIILVSYRPTALLLGSNIRVQMVGAMAHLCFIVCYLFCIFILNYSTDNCLGCFLCMSKVPSCDNYMKLANIFPVFKNGNTKLFNNYRPISILPAFSKILEKNSMQQTTTLFRD